MTRKISSILLVGLLSMTLFFCYKWDITFGCQGDFEKDNWCKVLRQNLNFSEYSELIKPRISMIRSVVYNCKNNWKYRGVIIENLCDEREVHSVDGRVVSIEVGAYDEIYDSTYLNQEFISFSSEKLLSYNIELRPSGYMTLNLLFDDSDKYIGYLCVEPQ